MAKQLSTPVPSSAIVRLFDMQTAASAVAPIEPTPRTAAVRSPRPAAVVPARDVTPSVACEPAARDRAPSGFVKRELVLTPAADETLVHLVNLYRRGTGAKVSASHVARAILCDPAVLLLDEATANLDLATEARVTAAMGIAASGRTTLVIAHRLSTAVDADKVVVVDDGRVVEVGTHHDLLTRDGPYAALWASFTGQPAPA